jgi:tight adherence protein B
MWVVIGLFGGLSAGLIANGSFDEVTKIARLRLSTLEASASRDLRAAARGDVSAGSIVRWSLILALIGFVVGVALTSLIGGIMLAVVGFLAPRRWLKRQQRVRLEQIEEALPSAVDQVVSSVRAGLSLSQALEEASRNLIPPISEEFATIHREVQLGARITDAIASAERRIGGRTFPLFSTALLTNIEKGGNLPEALQRIAEALKEIWRLEQKLITASAEARKATRVISAMPIVIAFMVMVIQPDLAASLTGTAMGWIILFLVLSLYLTGLAWLRRMIQPDV